MALLGRYVEKGRIMVEILDGMWYSVVMDWIGPEECESILDLLVGLEGFVERVVELWERNPVGVGIGVTFLPLVVVCLWLIPRLFKVSIAGGAKGATLEEFMRRDKINTSTGELVTETVERRFTRIG